MFRTLSAALALVAALPALAQPLARLDLRIVPQLGSPCNADPTVTDLPGTAHAPINLRIATSFLDRSRRFEVQYRLIDLDPTDATPTVALADMYYDIVATGAGDVGWLDRAYLSRNETSRSALGSPPGSIDTSGPPAEITRGQHEPFRYFVGSPSPANNHFNNGTPGVGGGGIPTPGNDSLRRIHALLLDPNGAGAPTNSPEWFGLYSFDWAVTPGLAFASDTSVTLIVSATTAAFFTEGSLLPIDIAVPTPAQATVMVTVPAPPAIFALVAVPGLNRRRRRRA